MTTRDFIVIPQGDIVLRDDRIKHQWKVNIEPFLLAKHLVTQKDYYAITKESPSTFEGVNNPVEEVSWKDAVTYCNLLSQKEGLQKCYSIREDMTFDPQANGYRFANRSGVGIRM